MFVRVVNPCALNQLQVVEQRKYVVQYGEGDDAVVARRSTAEEQVELTEETCKRRNARKAEHGDGKSDGEHVLLLGKSSQGIECLSAVVTDNAEDEEGEVIRNRVNEQVVDNGCLCSGCRTEEGNHDIAGLSDRAVGHEAAEPELL